MNRADRRKMKKDRHVIYDGEISVPYRKMHGVDRLVEMAQNIDISQFDKLTDGEFIEIQFYRGVKATFKVTNTSELKKLTISLDNNPTRSFKLRGRTWLR